MEQVLKKHIQKSITLSDEDFDRLMGHFHIQTFNKGESIFIATQPVENAYYVVSGLLKLVYTDQDAAAHIVSFAMEDWWESDFHAFFMKTKATMSLVCLENTTVFALSLDDYWQICDMFPQMERFLLHKSNMGFIGAQQRVLSLLSTNAKERYERLIAQYPALLQRVSKTQIAAYLGVSRETLSRL
ncbi:Crp/Fnr family transcriptional regulator [Dyadobacter tibetensis]|uniref:Crp/Fnr family transcriptional regulator n=1 Tax=Dyadobacter tibetensis TaxID=1211851 RepID=UPI00046EAD39|nr:Crp/Fnr family transcriptional regulator [Dyadobacter tibetensis]